MYKSLLNVVVSAGLPLLLLSVSPTFAQGLEVSIVAKDLPTSRAPKTYRTYDSIPEGGFKQWGAQRMGTRTETVAAADDFKYLEVLLLFKNKQVTQITVFLHDINLKVGTETVKPWEAITPYPRASAIRQRLVLDKGSSSGSIGHYYSEGLKCTLDPGDQTFLIALFQLSLKSEKGTLQVTPQRSYELEF